MTFSPATSRSSSISGPLLSPLVGGWTIFSSCCSGDSSVDGGSSVIGNIPDVTEVSGAGSGMGSGAGAGASGSGGTSSSWAIVSLEGSSGSTGVGSVIGASGCSSGVLVDVSDSSCFTDMPSSSTGMLEEISCWSAPASISLLAMAMVAGVVRSFENLLVVATIPARSAVATDLSIRFSVSLPNRFANIPIISETELAPGSLHSISPNFPGVLVVMLMTLASCMMRPCSVNALSRSADAGTSNATTKSTLKSP